MTAASEIPAGTEGFASCRRVGGAGLALAAAVALAACGGDGTGEADAPADSGGAAATGSTATAAPPPAAEGGSGVSAESTAAASDTLRPLRAFRVRIGNRGGDTVVVVADAGAGARTLDTVPPADSSRVRIETRARRLEIRARGGAGREAARALYDLERPAADTLLDFEVPPPGADTAG